MDPILSSDLNLNRLEQRLPDSQDDPRIRADAAAKLARLRAWIVEQKLDGVLISRRDNFAWLTIGGDNHVLNNSETGNGHLLITPEGQFLLAYSMDGERILEEQIPGQGYALEMVRWHQPEPRARALDLVKGRLAADTILPGAIDLSVPIDRLHEPLTELELDRCRWLGRRTALLLEELAGWIRPGRSEIEIARQMQAVFGLADIDLDVALVGTDERIHRFRHALPSARRLERVVLFHSAARRWGLHANVMRCASYGQPPTPTMLAFQSAAVLAAQVLDQLHPGLAFAEILKSQKANYLELGLPDEWQEHFQGGPTGYRIGDAARCFTDTKVVLNQAFDWFLTVEGVQVEDLTLLTSHGVEQASLGKTWPRTSMPTSSGSIQIPDLWIR